jgi:hypothetical protein
MTMPNERRRDRGHPGNGEWRAYADGEVALLRRMRLRAHAARCAECRERLRDTRATGGAASLLLRGMTPRLNVPDSWARLGVLTGGATRRAGMSPVSAFLAGGMAFTFLVAGVLLLHPGPTRALDRLHGVTPFASIIDQCCATEAGDAATRHGVLTLQVQGADPPLQVHYTDVDGSGTLSQGDIVRQVRALTRR